MDPKKYSVDLAVGGESDDNFLNNGTPNNLILLNDLKRNIHPWRDIKTLFKIYKLIKKNRYDIVHTHTAKAGVLGRIAAFMARTPNSSKDPNRDRANSLLLVSRNTPAKLFP